MGTQVCSPTRPHTARKGGVSLKIVSSRNRMTVRLRFLNPRCSPLLPVAKLVSAEPEHSEGACSDIPSGATLSTPCGGSHAGHDSLLSSGTAICYSTQHIHIPTCADCFPSPPTSCTAFRLLAALPGRSRSCNRCLMGSLFRALYIFRQLYTVCRLTCSRWVITVIFSPSFSHSRA